MKCPVCGEQLVPGQEVQRIPAPQRCKLGPKSGVLGFYPHENFDPQDDEWYIHYPQCCMGFFSPEDNPYIYDALVAEVREQLEEELREELKSELRADFENVKRLIGEKNFNFCIDCWKETEDPVNSTYPDDITICLWCKQSDQVWTKATNGGDFSYCARCQRYWDQFEDEVAAA